MTPSVMDPSKQGSTVLMITIKSLLPERKSVTALVVVCQVLRCVQTLEPFCENAVTIEGCAYLGKSGLENLVRPPRRQ